MKNKKLLILSCMAIMSFAALSGCNPVSGSSGPSNPGTSSEDVGGSSEESSETGSSVESSSEEEIEIVLNDTREELYTAIVAEEETAFKSLYEAANFVMENGSTGDRVYVNSDAEKRSSFELMSEDVVAGDYWFYYKDGNMLDGYSPYVTGDVEYYRGERYSRIMCASGYAAPTYQPYILMGAENSATQAWNRTYYTDATVRYNPKAFTGIQDTTYTFELTDTKIKPSYNEAQKVVPTITLSTTDSYNWSHQGLWMDINTGKWYYTEGEIQSDYKSLEYYDDEVFMTSTWNQETEEWTPNNDLRLSLSMVYLEDDDVTYNELTIEVLNEDGTVKSTSVKDYEFSGMTMRGTHRANITLDLMPSDDDYDEDTITPDFMCGAYMKDVVVSEAKGTVREGLTDDIYQGDSPMCCEAGQTYDLLYVNESFNNDTKTQVILDNLNAIQYNEVDGKDSWTISYEQSGPTAIRSQEVLDCEALIALIPDDATIASAEVKAAYKVYNKLPDAQKQLITYVDGYSKLEEILNS